MQPRPKKLLDQARDAIRLRVKDIDFAQHLILVRDAKGMKDRVTLLPDSLVVPLQEHLQRVRQMHQADREWGWQFVFPSSSLAKDPETGKVRRYYTSERTLQKAVARAVRAAGIHDLYPRTPSRRARTTEPAGLEAQRRALQRGCVCETRPPAFTGGAAAPAA